MKFTEEDLKRLGILGISKSRVQRQLDLLALGGRQVSLNRPCIKGDGISGITPEKIEKYLQLHQKASQAGRFLKFVPASGAATRMFQSCSQVLETYNGGIEVIRQAASQDKSVREFLKFWDNIEKFAFYDDLRKRMASGGYSLEAERQGNRFETVLVYLLMDRGLNYGVLPKALLKFHRYDQESRTAFEEHIEEGTDYLKDAYGLCRFHFTISPGHEENFRKLSKEALPKYRKRNRTNFRLDFSFQGPSTDSIAMGPDNTLVRDDQRRLILRPGGHGALLDNLNNLSGDLVYLKNIDNIAADHLKPLASFWNRVLGGLLVEVEAKVHSLLKRLAAEGFAVVSEELEAFAQETLLIHFPESYSDWSPGERKRFFLNKLNRPIRVCGMVPNQGEPGGGPFWVQQKDGGMSLQIVESGQVNMADSEQNKIWDSSTHFNPVNLVCSLRDYRRQPFDLNNYVDQDAVVICQKSLNGKQIKALELPGLWNGAMAEWNTIFVEVPGETFCPVKTVNDLLRPEHQPENNASVFHLGRVWAKSYLGWNAAAEKVRGRK
jgi:hypothetical protein